MNLFQSIQNGLLEIWSNKLRSFLTLSCVLLGVASIIVITGCIQGLFSSWKIYMSEAGGIEKLAITDAAAPDEQKVFAKISKGRTMRDAETILATSQYARLVSPEVALGNARFRRNHKLFRCPLTHGAIAAIFAINKFSLDQGQLISQRHVDHAENVVVIGTNIVDALYSPGEPVIGTSISINGVPFTVIGTLQKIILMTEGSKNSLDHKNNSAVIPITTMQKKIIGKPDLTWLNVQIKDPSQFREAVDEIDNIMTQAHRGIHNFRIETQAEMLKHYETQSRNFYLIGGGIGVITLIAAGINILNLMLASVNERVREIGIRKSLGAWNRDIFTQFLAEAISLSLLGGCIGILVAIVVIQILKINMPFSPPQVSPLAIIISLIFSVFVGIVSGMYPALRASQLDPIDALRYE
jgi:putative ABC transport system permease protein